MRNSVYFIVFIIYSYIGLSYALDASNCVSQGFLNCLTVTGDCTDIQLACSEQCQENSQCFFKCCKSGYCQMGCNNSSFRNDEFDQTSSSSRRSKKKINTLAIVLPSCFGFVGLILVVVKCIYCIRKKVKIIP